MRSWCRRRPPVAVRPRSTTSGATRSSRAAGNDWTGAAVNAANGLAAASSTGSGAGLSLVPLLIIGAVILLLVALLLLWSTPAAAQAARGRVAAAKRGGPDRPQRAGGGPHRRPRRPVALDRRRRRQRGADQQQRTGLAVEEFGQAQTEPFAKAVEAAEVILAQAFSDATATRRRGAGAPAERRDLLTRVVIVRAARANQELETQTGPSTSCATW